MTAASAEEQQALKFIQDFDFRVAQYSNNHKKLGDHLFMNLVPLLDKARDVKLTKYLIPAATRVQTFINSTSINLPLQELIDQFKANAEYTFVRHFDIVFIRYSVDRLRHPQEVMFIPSVVKGIASDTGKYVDALFNILLRLLRDLELPARGTTSGFELRRKCGLDDPKDAEYVAKCLGKLFLVVRGNLQQSLYRGLTEEEYNFLTLPNAKGIWSDDKVYSRSLTDANKKALNFTETCEKAARFLETDAFTDEERLLPALYASTHPKETISSLGHDMLRRTSLSTEDSQVVNGLYATYSKCGYATRTRILRLLSKSRVAASDSHSIQALFITTFTELHAFETDPWAELTSVETLDGLQDRRATPLPLAENAKACLDFLGWVAEVAGLGEAHGEFGTFVSGSLWTALNRHLGWPEPFPWKRSATDLDLRNRIYDLIGKWTKTFPASEAIMLTTLKRILRSFVEDNSSAEVSVYLTGATSAIASVFRPQETPVLQDLSKELLEVMLAPNPLPRYAVTKIANECLPFNNVKARWIDILAVSGVLDNRKDVADEGHRGLDPWTHYRDTDGLGSLPDWKEMALSYFTGEYAYFFKEGPSAFGAPPREPIDFVRGEAWGYINRQWAEALLQAVKSSITMLYLAALPDFSIQPGWPERLRMLVSSDAKTRDTVRACLSDPSNEPALVLLLGVALTGQLLVHIDNVPRADFTKDMGALFAILASMAPSSAVGKLTSRIAYLDDRTWTNDPETRVLAATSFGIVAAHPSIVVVSKDETIAVDNVTPAQSAQARKYLLSLFQSRPLSAGHMLSRQVYYGTISVSDIDDEILHAASFNIQNRNPDEIQALLEVWTAGIPVFGSFSGNTDRVKYMEDMYIKPLVDLARTGNRRAISALGRLAMACDIPEVVDLVLSRLYELHDLKEAEVHLAVGEAVAAAVACWESSAVQLTLDVDTRNASFRKSRRPEKLNQVLDDLLAASADTKPSLVKALGMVLYCIIQYCPLVPEVQARLRHCHTAFMRLLTARDDFVQETASRALALIYEICEPSLKDSLVRDFVAFFTGSGQQLKDDEEPAADNAAPSSRTITSSISYKDIVRLANEAGDQKLVYKFMVLANSAINWKSDSVFGRFGLRDILARPELGVDEKLYPILFRSRFDPSPTTRASMQAIWDATVKDPNSALDTHFDAIMTSLLKSMLGREWRVRQASCDAVRDLIGGRPFQKYQPYYKEMLAAVLKLLDDMKGSVRDAASAFFSYLTQVLIRQLEDLGSSATTTAMMDEIVPFLLSDRGIDSSAADVKDSAAKAIQDIAKRGGIALRPYIVAIVPCLLGLLSTYEPEVINYAYQLSGQDTREQLDKSRATAVYRSPIYESILNCLSYADGEVVNNLVPVLEETAKTAVGMPTKIGCSGVIVHLAERHKEDFEPHCTRFLRLMEKKLVLDPNDTVSKNYCKAGAHLVRIANIDDSVSFVKQVMDLWFASEDETRRRKVVDVVLGIRHSAPDHFDALESVLLPFIFLGMNEHADEYVHKQCEQLWSSVGGSPHKVRRYLDEIIDLSNRSLGVGNWPVKHAGALTAGKVVTTLVEGRIADAKSLTAVWPVLEKSLALKTWDRKHELLNALAAFAEAAVATHTLNDSDVEALRKIALREAKRNNEVYRAHVFKVLPRIAAALKVDMLDEISDVVGPSQ